MFKEKKVFIPLLLYFILIAGLIFWQRSRLFFAFSPQAKVNPLNTSEEYDKDCRFAVCDNKKITVPLQNGVEFNPVFAAEEEEQVRDDKRIEVDLTNQRVYAFEGDRKVYDFTVSTGKFNRTPTGEFRIWIKLRYTRMTGGSQALGTYYDLPNVPYVMYFSNDRYPQSDGYGLHGTYWHSNFGTPMSHGCINLKTEDAQKLYFWANPKLKDSSSIKVTDDNQGTKVIIYGQSPAI